MRSSEHAAHRPLMHSVHIALWLKSRLVCHPCHPCMRICGWCLELSVFFLVFLVFYFLSLFLFQLFLMSTSAPDERSMSNPLCDSSLGSVVTSDYVTPLTHQIRHGKFCRSTRRERCTNKLRSGCSQVEGNSKTSTEGIYWHDNHPTK